MIYSLSLACGKTSSLREGAYSAQKNLPQNTAGGYCSVNSIKVFVGLYLAFLKFGRLKI